FSVFFSNSTALSTSELESWRIFMRAITSLDGERIAISLKNLPTSIPAIGLRFIKKCLLYKINGLKSLHSFPCKQTTLHVTRGTSQRAGLNQPNHVDLPEWINTLSYG